MRGHFERRRYIDKKTAQRKTSSTWSVWYDEPSDDGSRKQKIKSGFRTRKEAELWFSRKSEELRYGIARHDEQMTVERYLEQWLESLEQPGSKVKAEALRAYRNHCNSHIIPAIGKVRLSELNAGHVEKAKALWSATHCNGTQARMLSQRTVRHIFATLNAALNRAKRRRLIVNNPCEYVDAPSFEQKEMPALDAAAGKELLRAFEGTHIHAAVVTALGTGLRRGELLALCWKDIDLVEQTLTVNRALEHVDGNTRFKEPKTRRSRRTISLPGFVADRLRRHRVEQGERFLRDGLGRPTVETLVFERGGEPWVPNTFGTFFWRVLKDAGLPHIRLHDLRHSFASMANAAGVDLKAISFTLGHSTISTTADIYAHLFDPLKRDAAERINQVLAPDMLVAREA